MLVSCVHPVAILRAVFCTICSLSMFVSDALGDHYGRICTAAVQIVSNLPAPSNGGPIYRFLGKPAMRTRWMAGAVAHKSG